jgi:hypothetical protein
MIRHIATAALALTSLVYPQVTFSSPTHHMTGDLYQNNRSGMWSFGDLPPFLIECYQGRAWFVWYDGMPEWGPMQVTGGVC